jgi:hypothetical protein
MSFQDVIAAYVLGYTRVEDLPNAAAEALGDGLDSASLRQLAGAQGDDSKSIIQIFPRAVGELSMTIPSVTDAAHIYSIKVARDIVAGRILPYEGARTIWQVYVKCPRDELRPFVGLASEYQDDRKHRDEYARLIVEESRRLWHPPSPRSPRRGRSPSRTCRRENKACNGFGAGGS